jgi:hypothetical protein
VRSKARNARGIACDCGNRTDVTPAWISAKCALHTEALTPAAAPPPRQ